MLFVSIFMAELYMLHIFNGETESYVSFCPSKKMRVNAFIHLIFHQNGWCSHCYFDAIWMLFRCCFYCLPWIVTFVYAKASQNATQYTSTTPSNTSTTPSNSATTPQTKISHSFRPSCVAQANSICPEIFMKWWCCCYYIRFTIYCCFYAYLDGYLYISRAMWCVSVWYCKNVYLNVLPSCGAFRLWHIGCQQMLCISI